MLDLSKNFPFVFSHTSVQLDFWIRVIKNNVQNLMPFARRQNNFPRHVVIQGSAMY